MHSSAKCDSGFRKLLRSKKGFTLVELLVVIAIIGVLVALLLPAIQAAREAARRSQCVNNLKQVGLGLLNYESAKKILPPGAFWECESSVRFGAQTRHGSMLVHILPYIEQQTVYDQFDFSKESIDGQTLSNSIDEIGATLISSYQCPSDDHDRVVEAEQNVSIEGVVKVAFHNYTASRGSNKLGFNPGCSCAEIPIYNGYETPKGGGVYEAFTDFSGPFTRRCTQVALKEIGDGLSNTIFVGEVRPMCSWHNDNGWATSNNGHGYTSTVVPINYDTCSREGTGNGCHRYCNWNTEAGFRSAHPGGCNFAFGDGSVQFLSETIDHLQYQRLGAKNDGQTVSIQF